VLADAGECFDCGNGYAPLRRGDSLGVCVFDLFIEGSMISQSTDQAESRLVALIAFDQQIFDVRDELSGNPLRLR
jgi:hypothetical protein